MFENNALLFEKDKIVEKYTTTEMTLIKDKESAQEKFRTWASQVDTINSQDTINAYWSQIKNLPDFDLTKLKQETQEQEEKHRDRIAGLIDRNISSKHQLQAVRRLITSKLFYIKKDDSIDHATYMRIKIRTNELLENIDLDETDNSTVYDKIENHYIRKDDFVELLRRAEPVRAKYWTSTYLLGVRWFASKTLEDDLFFGHRGEHGVVRIPDERTKSKGSRDVYLNSSFFWKVIDSAPMGKWVDRHGRKWEDVYFPDREQDKENYQLGQRQNGKVYGLVGDIGLSPRTIHSLRHTRITDLLKGEDMKLGKVQDRVGHSDTSSTNHYTQVKFNRDPQSLEQYCKGKQINLIKIIEED